MALTHFQLACEPQPDSAAIVRGSAVRFTVLTSRLIRLEYSATEEFEDRPSQAFWYRRQPLPQYQVQQNDQLIEIETEHVHLRYTPSARGFTPGTLSIDVKATDSTWFFGDHIGKSGNLRGTTRTLDLTNGFAELDPDALQLTLSTGKPSLIANRDRRADTIREMLRAFKLDSRVKADIDHDLPGLLSGEIALLRYGLSAAQSSALTQVLSERAK